METRRMPALSETAEHLTGEAALPDIHRHRLDFRQAQRGGPDSSFPRISSAVLASGIGKLALVFLFFAVARPKRLSSEKHLASLVVDANSVDKAADADD
jgi:hypothetical protein